MQTSYNLPDDVFGPEEARPTKGKKAKAGKAAETNARKRTMDEANLDVRMVRATWNCVRHGVVPDIGIVLKNLAADFAVLTGYGSVAGCQA